ncbi:hypothetical protein LTR50_007798 [Elasticomyces elasticus]|nr:hypothetical protein LTR50_007798 [Elasticomyces elasticus]
MGFLDKLPSPPPWLLLFFRIAQFVDAIVSLVLYGIYLAHVFAGSRSPGHAVLGIAAAAVVWTIAAFLQHAWAHRENLKSGHARKGMIKKGGMIAGAAVAFIVIDLCFVVLFAASAGIVGSNMKSCGAGTGSSNNKRDDNNDTSSSPMTYCGLLKGALALSVINIFNFLTSSVINSLQGMQTPPNPKSLIQNPTSLVKV